MGVMLCPRQNRKLAGTIAKYSTQASLAVLGMLHVAACWNPFAQLQVRLHVYCICTLHVPVKAMQSTKVSCTLYRQTKPEQSKILHYGKIQYNTSVRRVSSA